MQRRADVAQVLLYEMIVGKSPFRPKRRQSEVETYDRIVQRKISFPSFVTSEERDLLERLLESSPDKRIGVESRHRRSPADASQAAVNSAYGR